MNQLPTGEPVWELHFNESGGLTAPAAADFLGEVAAKGVTNLFVFSHGWGTSQDDARNLYDAMFPLIRAAARAGHVAKVGFAGVYWPSLWFPPTPATPPGTASSTQSGTGAVIEPRSGSAAVSGAEIAAALRPGFSDPGQQETVAKIGRLIDEAQALVGSDASEEVKQQRLTEIAQLMQSLTPVSQDATFEDTGERALLLTIDPKAAYEAAADVFGSVPAGGAQQGIGDWFGKAVNGVKDGVRVLSYTVMKNRAGEVGRTGLGPLLATLHDRSPAVRVHLIGHSFGARLVAFALAGVGAPEHSPVSSLLLVQGAFSHWSFAHAVDNPFGEAGPLNAYADRVHGPLVSTYSRYDWAVGVWYPKASFMSQQDVQGAETGSRWGGMGGDGFHAVKSLQKITMAEGGTDGYGFEPGTFYAVDAANVINDTSGQPFAGAHSDIRKPAVAQLAVAAAAVGG